MPGVRWGAGPFQFVEALDGKYLLLRRFEDYYGGSAAKPPVQVAPLSEVAFETESGLNEQIAGLKNGRWDIVFYLPAGAVPILEMMPDVRLVKGPGTRSYFADINCLKPPYDDVRVRRALNHAIDKKVVVDKILSGRGQVLSTVVLPAAFACNQQLEPYAHDLFLARTMLGEAGFPKQKNIVVACHSSERLLADIMSFFLTKAGLRPRVTVGDARRPGELGAEAEWDLFVSSWGNSTLEPSGILQPKLSTGGAGNFSGYSNAEVDQLLVRAEGMADDEARAAVYRKNSGDYLSGCSHDILLLR